MVEITELKGDIWQVDLEERGEPGSTAGYFIKGDRDWMLLETGPASSAENILEAAARIGIAHQQVKHMGVTHIHIDHAGGLGTMCCYFSEAKLWVHPRGIKHMIDPTRLIAGSRAAHGEKKMQQFGEILPVPENRLTPALDGCNIHLGDRVLEVWETPGHARHHVCFYDTITRGLFSGDEAGVYFPRLSKLLNRPVLRPSTPAPDFDGALMQQSLNRLALYELEAIYYTHFGAAAPAQFLLELVIGQLSIQMHMAKTYQAEQDALQKLGIAVRQQLAQGLGLPTARAGEKLDQRLGNEIDLLLEPSQNSAAGLLVSLNKNNNLH